MVWGLGRRFDGEFGLLWPWALPSIVHFIFVALSLFLTVPRFFTRFYDGSCIYVCGFGALC